MSMTQLLSPLLAQVQCETRGRMVGFWCPGCKEDHILPVSADGEGPRWSYNGNPQKPTFTPSILVRSGHFATGYKPGDSCWCTWNKEEGETGFNCVICHSFVTDGMIQFLPDCTHELAGKTVPIPNYPRGTLKPSPYDKHKEQ